MGENSLTLKFSLAEHVEIPLGSYCEFMGETYTLDIPENLKMNHSRSFDYTVTMSSSQAHLVRYKFRNTIDRRLKFSLTAKPQEHLQMLIDNLNLRETGWIAGECIEGTEKLISYNHTTCMDALSQIAEAFETEWEVTGKTISLKLQIQRHQHLMRCHKAVLSPFNSPEKSIAQRNTKDGHYTRPVE